MRKRSPDTVQRNPGKTSFVEDKVKFRACGQTSFVEDKVKRPLHGAMDIENRFLEKQFEPGTFNSSEIRGVKPWSIPEYDAKTALEKMYQLKKPV